MPPKYQPVKLTHPMKIGFQFTLIIFLACLIDCTDKSYAAAGQIKAIPAPNGYTRVQTTEFGSWLRTLPLKPGGAPVLLHNGRLKGEQGVHYRVIDLPIGKLDLEQCADAIMRLRADYWYFHKKTPGRIAFYFTSGHRFRYSDYRRGIRPKIKGNSVRFLKTAKPDSSVKAYRRYMNIIYSYAGTASLARELKTIKARDLRIGDIVLQGGFPGHAVLVVDMAVSAAGKKIVMLAQSFMPAQEIHILKHSGGPWFHAPVDGQSYKTPEWTFPAGSLKRFVD